jgi:hypothetical protein
MPKFLGRFSTRGFFAFLGALLPAENGADATFFFGACNNQPCLLSSHDGGVEGEEGGEGIAYHLKLKVVVGLEWSRRDGG